MLTRLRDSLPRCSHCLPWPPPAGGACPIRLLRHSFKTNHRLPESLRRAALAKSQPHEASRQHHRFKEAALDEHLPIGVALQNAHASRYTRCSCTVDLSGGRWSPRLFIGRCGACRGHPRRSRRGTQIPPSGFCRKRSSLRYDVGRGPLRRPGVWRRRRRTLVRR